MDSKYFCKNCKGLRNHKAIFEHKVKGEEEDYNFQWINQYKVIECNGCENISFLKIYGDNTMIKQTGEHDYDYYEEEIIFPYYLQKGNEISQHHLPNPIKEIYKETILAFKADAFILTAGGFRAIIEALCNFLKIKKGNLEERINLLHNKGHLTLSESKRLHSIRFLGNDALHEIEKPKKAQLEILLEIINHLLSNLFVNDKIIKGKMDTIIDTYKDFIKHIQSRITKEMLKKEFQIDELLGKSKRLVSKDNLKKYLMEMNKEIESGAINYLEMVDENSGIYKVIDEPELSFFWNE
jgi:hypothetical protein